MRLPYFILFVGAILTTGSATSDADQTTIATVTSPDQDRLLNTDLNNAVNVKRFLRAQPMSTIDKDEERFWKTIKVSKLEDILTNTDGKQVEKFGRWKEKNIKPADITQRIKAYMPYDQRYWGIGILYYNYLHKIKSTVTHKRLPDSELAKFTVLTDSQVAKPISVTGTEEGTSGVTSFFRNWWTR